MVHAVHTIDDLVAARHLRLGPMPTPSKEDMWSPGALSGRLVEIFAAKASAALTATLSLVARAQFEGERVVWISSRESCFFPPDAEMGGVELPALAVVRLQDPGDIPATADKLVRSGAFGMVVMDMSPSPTGRRRGEVRGARLAGLARKHDTVVIALTDERTSLAPLGPMVSLKGEARRTSPPAPLTSPPAPLQLNAGEGRGGSGKIEVKWGVEIKIVRDKQGAPGWSHVEYCRAPAGLR